MPPKARQNSSNFAEKEERILLAISALEKQKICNIREVACVYNISRTTLQRRLNEIASRADTRANSYKIT
jgi:DNA invertase Pin-like site-specific DNA recombinase